MMRDPLKVLGNSKGKNPFTAKTYRMIRQFEKYERNPEKLPPDLRRKFQQCWPNIKRIRAIAREMALHFEDKERVDKLTEELRQFLDETRSFTTAIKDGQLQLPKLEQLPKEISTDEPAPDHENPLSSKLTAKDQNWAKIAGKQ